jgi:hypothetical protein
MCHGAAEKKRRGEEEEAFRIFLKHQAIRADVAKPANSRNICNGSKDGTKHQLAADGAKDSDSRPQTGWVVCLTPPPVPAEMGEEEEFIQNRTRARRRMILFRRRRRRRRRRRSLLRIIPAPFGQVAGPVGAEHGLQTSRIKAWSHEH